MTSEKAVDLIRSLAPSYSLHDAAAAGDANAVDLLLYAGLPSDARNAKGSTPLHLAANKGHDAIVGLLLDRGAPVDAANEDGNTPLHAAVAATQLGTAKQLLSAGATADAPGKGGVLPMRIAARHGDGRMIQALREHGAEMDIDTANAAFWAAVSAVEKTPDDEALSADVPRLLHHIFDADMRHFHTRDKSVTNRTCMQPAGEGVSGAAESMKYIFDRDSHSELPLKEGRRCEAGRCCDACSRVTFPEFALLPEIDREVFYGLEDFNFNECHSSDTATVLNFMRLVERMRRSIAHEYGLPLHTLLPVQAYSRPYKTESVVCLHTDEATHAVYHYSCVLYLTTRGEDFEGGSFVWNDPPEEEGGDRIRTPFDPHNKGSAVIFSSGWENMHEVEPLESGNRFAVPCFFTTEPVPIESIEHMGGVPQDDEAIADDLQYLVLTKQYRAPTETPGIVKALMMKWHLLCAPEWAPGQG